MELNDPGTLSLLLQIAILLMLIVSLPSAKRKNGKSRPQRHGYLTFAALVLHSVLIFGVMVPSFDSSFAEILAYPLFTAFAVWSHIVLGSLAEILAIWLVGYWLLKSPSKLACYKLKAWMTPVFVIWAVSLVGGMLIHVLGII